MMGNYYRALETSVRMRYNMKTHSQMTVLLSKQNVATGGSQGYGSGRLTARKYLRVYSGL